MCVSYVRINISEKHAFFSHYYCEYILLNTYERQYRLDS
nr:MAG TPA: hypothetical protein [Caudoviricetes sp.]DAR30035.1 MAG TPA: hypothetical protein [Caudoviricetes sp.]